MHDECDEHLVEELGNNNEGNFADECDQYYDEKTGGELPPRLVMAAAEEEVEFMRKIELYEVVSLEECYADTGASPISTKWARTNKGTEQAPDIRCRLVARDFKPKGEKDRADLFAATPPLEAKRLLFRQTARHPTVWRRGGYESVKIRLIDVKKAHLNAQVTNGEMVYVQLPPEDHQVGMCARLKRWLYGMRPAASAWEHDYSDKLESVGFKKGAAAPTVFFNAETQVRCVVHGDDFTFSGAQRDLEEITAKMKTGYELKVRANIGGQPNDDREATTLNRKLCYGEKAITYEADPTHVKLICEALGLNEDSNGLVAPIGKDTKYESDDVELGKAEARLFRATAARANFLAIDRPDIQYATKEICRDMSRPKVGSWKRLKRLARYLVEHTKVIWKFGADGRTDDDDQINVYSDSDWTGCLETRKSTSGGIACVGVDAIKSWSSTQATIAISSGEAEYYALVKSAAEGLGIQSLAEDLGWNLDVVIWVDATAAKSLASRVGLGKIRHLETKYLWVQEAVQRRRITIKKIWGQVNRADVLTKPQNAETMRVQLARVNIDVHNRGSQS